MIRLFRTACVYFSIRRPSPESYQASTKRKGAREGKKRGTRICFHWHTRAELGSFRKNLFSRANYVATVTHVTRLLSPVSLSRRHVFCILPSVYRQLVGDGWMFALRRGTGANDHDNGVPSSMTAWHIKRKPPIRDKRFPFSSHFAGWSFVDNRMRKTLTLFPCLSLNRAPSRRLFRIAMESSSRLHRHAIIATGV